VRQFAEGEARIYDRISGLLTATVAIVLVLTGLCVMGGDDQRGDGAEERRRLDEGHRWVGAPRAAAFSLAEGRVAWPGRRNDWRGRWGFFCRSDWAKRFLAWRRGPRLIVYPVAVALTIIVAILSAYPLRRLASIRPASVFQG